MKQVFQNMLKFVGSLNENKFIVARYRLIIGFPAGLLARLGVGPTLLNFVGIVFGIASAVLIANGGFIIAAVLLLIAGLADGLDGAVARFKGIANDFGNFVDSVFDRYVDTAVMLGILWYYAFLNDTGSALLAVLTIIGTVITSYTKAKGESLGVTGRYIGFMNRPERTMVVLLGLFFPQLLPLLLWPLAIFTNVTAVHRLVFYSSKLRSKDRGKDSCFRGDENDRY